MHSYSLYLALNIVCHQTLISIFEHSLDIQLMRMASNWIHRRHSFNVFEQRFLLQFCTHIWAPSSEFVSSSIPSWQILTAHAQPFRGARDLAFWLKIPLDSLLVWASSGGSGETARMRRLAWTFAARIGNKYQIRLTRSIFFFFFFLRLACPGLYIHTIWIVNHRLIRLVDRLFYLWTFLKLFCCYWNGGCDFTCSPTY